MAMGKNEQLNTLLKDEKKDPKRINNLSQCPTIHNAIEANKKRRFVARKMNEPLSYFHLAHWIPFGRRRSRLWRSARFPFYLKPSLINEFHDVKWSQFPCKCHSSFHFISSSFFLNLLAEYIALTSGKVSWIIAAAHQIWYAVRTKKKVNSPNRTKQRKKLNIHFEQLFLATT